MPRLRYFLFVAVLAGAAAAPAQTSQASDLRAEHRNGQTFLSFKEATSTPAPEGYNVYRSITPIRTKSDLTRATLVGTVPKGSGKNQRAGGMFLLEAGGTPLQPGEGYLFVTATENRAFYYAVTAVTGGQENTSVVVGSRGNSSDPVRETVAPVKPVLQSVTGGSDRRYVHFLPAISNAAVKAQTNRRGRALNYRVYYDASRSGPRSVYVFLHQRAGSYKTAPLPFPPANAVQVFLDDDNPPAVHDLWFGYHEFFAQAAPKGTVRSYTEERILWTLAQVQNDPAVQADKNRVYCIGASFGAMGSLAMGVRYADVFAAVGGLVPAFGLTHSDFSLKADTNALFGTPTQNLPTNLGARIYDLFDYATLVSKLRATGTAPMFFTLGRGDGVTGWTEKPAFFRAAHRARQPMAFYWDLRTHAGTGAWSALETKLFQELTQIRLDRPLPAFSNLTLDDDPGPGDRTKGDLVGTMAGYVTFDPATASETTAKVVLDIGLKNDPTRLDYAKQAIAYTDLTWRRLRKFPVQAGKYYRVQARKKGTTPVLEERVVTPDASGLLTVPMLAVERDMRTVEIEPWPTVPEMHLGGDARIGGVLAVSLSTAKGQFAVITIGGIEGSLKTQWGVWNIMDPIVLWGGATPVSGHLEALARLPNEPRLRGVRALAQALIGSTFENIRISNLARITLR